MGIGRYLSQGMKRMGGGDWESIQCVEKIQEMLSRAIRDQEDMWKILLSTSSTPSDKLGEKAGTSQFGDQLQQQLEAGCNEQQQQQTTCSKELVPERILRPLMAKIENSLDWCHLALCRLKEISTTTPQSPASATPLQQQAGGTSMPRRYPNLQAAPNLKLLHAPLSARGIPTRTEDSAVLQDGAFPVSHFLRHYSRGTSSVASLADQSATDETAACGLERSLSMLAPDLEPIQGQNFKGMINPALGLMGTDDWPQLQVESAMEHIGAVAALAGQCNKLVHKSVEQQQQVCTSEAFPRSLSSNMGHLKIRADESDISCAIQDTNNDDDAPRKISRSRSMTSKRNQSRLKRDREAAAADGDLAVREHMMVAYQRLRPGVDTKKAIPQDGHRGWKKYGKKSIQNANFCRGYYKCSVKECNAKKTVQPTDADPSLFEVTYSGTHTCSSMSKKQKRVQLDHPDQLSQITATPDEAPAAPAACHEMNLGRETASTANASGMKDGDQQEDLAGPVTPENGVSVLCLLSTAIEAAAAVEDKGLAVDVTAKRFSTLPELAAGSSGRHDIAEPTNSSGADLESLEAISSDSSMPGSCCHDYQDRKALGNDDQSTSVDMIDTYILSTVTSNIAGGLTLHDPEGYSDLKHHDQWQLVHNDGDQANNFQDSLFDWPDLLMDNKLL